MAKELPTPEFAKIVAEQIRAGNTPIILDHRNREQGKVPEVIEATVRTVRVMDDDPDC